MDIDLMLFKVIRERLFDVQNHAIQARIFMQKQIKDVGNIFWFRDRTIEISGQPGSCRQSLVYSFPGCPDVLGWCRHWDNTAWCDEIAMASSLGDCILNLGLDGGGRAFEQRLPLIDPSDQ